jgi:uncharacterized protein (DUF952 family)
MMTELIFKIIPAEEWEDIEKAGIYYGSEHDSRDGFLHFSTAAQLLETIRRHYSGAWSVVVIAVKAAALGEALKYEHSATRKEDFPHLYGPLDIILEPAEGATVAATFCTVLLIEQNFLKLWLDELAAKYGGQTPL